MSGSLEGQIAFVTGAGSGIGRACALALAEAGAAVACFDRNPASNRATTDLLTPLTAVAAVEGDVSSEEQVSAAVEQATRALGAPTIVINAAGIAVRKRLLDTSAADWAAVLAVLLYDHRNLGASDGELRQDIDPWAQIRDMRTAISYLQARAEVDAGRIGLWGTSYSGGHVLAVAGIDKRVKCVVSQVPLISGIETLRRVSSAEALPQLQAALDADRAAGLTGAAPATLPITSDDPTAAVAFPGPRTYQFLVESEPARRASSWRNSCTLRSIDHIQEYDVSPFLRHISPAPLLLIVASLVDNTTPTDVALTAFNSALEPKRAIVIPGDHYSPYFADEDFAQCSAAARDWFVQHLGRRAR